MDLLQLGASLCSARKTAGVSQGDLARSLGMSRATISALENGTINEIGIRKVISLCAAVGLELYVAPEQRRPTLDELKQEHRAAKLRT